MAYHKTNLFPVPAHFKDSEANVPLTTLKETGAYPSLQDLLEVHVDLLSEDYLCSIAEQINSLRNDPDLIKTNADCYEMQGAQIEYEKRGRFLREIGVLFTFDPKKYQDVDWDEEKRLMRNNVVFLFSDNLTTFDVGFIEKSGPNLLQKGNVVIKIAEGYSGDSTFPLLKDFTQFVNKTYLVVESSTFHFPYLIVTNRLRMDSRLARFNSSIVEVGSRADGMSSFEQEIVFCKFPARRPEYDKESRDMIKSTFWKVREGLNSSQATAIYTALKYRVALVQGPPGTGKTYLGAKVIHCTSDKHELGGNVEYGLLQKKYKEVPHSAKLEVMARAEVIGMTTTRAACVREQLDKLNIKLMIVEEAAEVLEAHILASIPMGAEHIVQIGDHRQLKPICAHAELGERYKMDLSLFERLVNNGAVCPMLSEQRRMRPAIADLVRFVYPNLTDHFSTLGRPPLNGVDLKEPVFFQDHLYAEKKVGKGYVNEEEATVAVELCNYLIQRGHHHDTITILTTYRRQLRLLKQLIEQHKSTDVQALRATTVDSFQGEENEIIILSLVRSNPQGNIGFLKMQNRACVALSRARKGKQDDKQGRRLFLPAGKSTVSYVGEHPLWLHVQRTLDAEKRIGPSLPLICPRHKDRFLASSAEDIRSATGSCCLCMRMDALCRKLSESRLV